MVNITTLTSIISINGAQRVITIYYAVSNYIFGVIQDIVNIYLFLRSRQVDAFVYNKVQLISAHRQVYSVFANTKYTKSFVIINIHNLIN